MKIFKFVILFLSLVTVNSFGKIKIVCSLTDFASLANELGGERVEAISIAKPSDNPHNIEVLPSYMIKVAKAQIYVQVGVSLDSWAESIIHGSRNTHLKTIDASQGIELLEIPTGKVDASMGDIHPGGNPHYWLNPNNATFIAKNIHKALLLVDPEGSAYYNQKLTEFNIHASQKNQAFLVLMKPLANQAVLTYHSSWPYFAKAFGLRIVGKLEPVPGIPPTAKHLNDLLKISHSEKVIALIQEPYFSNEGGAFLKQNAGIPTRILSPSCKSVEAQAYWNHMDEIIHILTSK